MQFKVQIADRNHRFVTVATFSMYKMPFEVLVSFISCEKGFWTNNALKSHRIYFVNWSDTKKKTEKNAFDDESCEQQAGANAFVNTNLLL